MHQLVAIALGGSAGAIMRFLAANGIYAALGRDFPHGTLFVNVFGSLLMGFLTELLVHRLAVAVEYRAAILVGFLGAFTTFSTFAMETLTLFEQGNLLKAFLNIFLSVTLCLTACWVGVIWGRTLFSDNRAAEALHYLSTTGLICSFVTLFAISILAEILINRFDLTAEMRVIFFVGLLGSLSIGLTLWTGLQNPALQTEFHHLLGLFILNALWGVAIIWSGSRIGCWIWQFKLSQ